ncbi:ComF family protein [Flavobacterium noncentrifugens]|uniref:ComF family protein n=1 Tax=Flavobacterium noncentrifugens TaxID=1128970 RepID=A0A1G8SJD9_9FLAO|nr:ComF family protein [Flavobacterium noncentrifugens]SDJ29321.1 comF family protein [Flavobacterium noncentrifugens]
MDTNVQGINVFLIFMEYTPFKMLTHLINLFFPRVCAGCDSLLLSNENVICTNCRHEIPVTNHFELPDNEAMKKFYGKIPVEFAAAFVYYHKKGIVQEMIHRLKYKGNEEVGTLFGLWFANELKKLPILKDVDAVVPVPLHPRKLRERGYNQVDSFGMALAESLTTDYQRHLLLRKIYSKTQTRKNLLKRSEIGNRDIFDVDFTEKDHHKHYLLVDDVLTTGSTLEACGRALLKIPGARISIVTIAMSHS